MSCSFLPVPEDVHVSPAVDALALVADGAAADRHRLPLPVLEPPTVPRGRQLAGACKVRNLNQVSDFTCISVVEHE